MNSKPSDLFTLDGTESGPPEDADEEPTDLQIESEIDDAAVEPYIASIKWRRSSPSGISNHSLLSPEEEMCLATAWLQNADMDARAKLCAAHQRFVTNIARIFHPAYRDFLTFSDSVQNGNIGLIRACDKFDPTRGVRFARYAFGWIKYRICYEGDMTANLIYLPTTIMKKRRRLRRAAKELEAGLERSATRDELAQVLGISLEELCKILTLPEVELSLDASSVAYRDYLLAPILSTDAPFDALHDRELVRYVLSMMEERDQFILRKRFGLGGDDELTLEKIGDKLGVSKQRIGEIVPRALMRFRALLENVLLLE